ncbi:MAG: FkbM family methyltransferase [Gammaproteobacteria bacterium]
MTETLINSRQELFGDRTTGIYDLLSFVEPGLMLDVGAATGGMTRLMLKNSPASRVYALEPFPENFPHFEQRIGSDERVKLFKQAVAEQRGESAFYVSSTVSGSEPGWEKFAGCSSLGYLTPDPTARARSWRSAFSWRTNKPPKLRGQTIRVEMIPIDAVVSERVRFMKIDVQGGELGVLKSAAGTMTRHGIDMLFVEFLGEFPVAKFLADRGYAIYDHLYSVLPKSADADTSRWTKVSEGRLSTGRISIHGWPIDPPREIHAYCSFLNRQRTQVGNAWTDLVCVAPHFTRPFLDAAHAAMKAAS